MSLRYLLVVVTHGHPSSVYQALASFREKVTPMPVAGLLYADGEAALSFAAKIASGNPWTDWTTAGTWQQQGFCAATRECWQRAARSVDVDYVYWLEHDFIHNEPVDLEELAAVLHVQPELAQMALRRQPVSAEEKAAGGYVEMRPHEYTDCELGAARWMEHRLFWTTNPSLIPQSIPAAYPWPNRPECEGHFGIELLRDRPFTRFGLWGARTEDPYVQHIGVRTGHGY